jgi:hypothetical protein
LAARLLNAHELLQVTLGSMEAATKIWRYTDLAKFIAILSRGLHFSRPSALGDEWEGTWGVKNIARFKKEYFGHPEQGANEWNARIAEKRRQLGAVGISCWHRSDCESAALWSLYVPLGFGVAIQSTVGQIISGVAALDRTVELLEVDYVDYNQEELPSDPSILLGRKRLEFRYENEVRFLLRLTDDEKKAICMLERISSERDTRWLSLSPINGGLVRPGPGITVRDDTSIDRSTPVGVHLRLAAASYIQRVYLAPKVAHTIRYAVRDVVEKYGLDPRIVCESNKDMIAPDRLKFFP